MGKHIKVFEEYVSKFDKTNPKIKLKIDHSYRVMFYQELLSSLLNFSKDDIKLAEIIGLFHDIGRFEQIKDYNTFFDNKSMDHGDYGVEVLKSLGYTDEVLLNSVKYHNKYRLPDDLDSSYKLQAMLIRDTDKLDNINMEKEAVFNERTIPLNLIEFFKQKQMIDYKLVKTDLDGLLCELSFIFDINFKETLNYIKNSNILDTYINNIYNQTKDNNIFVIKGYIDRYINRKIEVKNSERIRQKIQS